MKLHWSIRETLTTGATVYHEDGTYTSYEIVGVARMVTASVTDIVQTPHGLQRFECLNFFTSKEEAQAWVEEKMMPKLAEAYPAARSFPSAPRLEPVVDWHWADGLGMYKDEQGLDDISFYVSFMGTWGSGSGFKVAAYDWVDGIYCSMLVNTRDEAEQWAVDFIKKMRP